MAVRRAGRVATQVRDGEEMHKLHDILPLPIALNGETEERDEMEPERINLNDHLMGVSDIYTVDTIRYQHDIDVRPRSVWRPARNRCTVLPRKQKTVKSNISKKRKRKQRHDCYCYEIDEHY
jgi:hypothetical protein